MDIDGGDGEVFEGRGNVEGCVFGVDGDFREMRGDSVKRGVECVEVGVGEREDGMWGLDDVGIVDGVGELGRVEVWMVIVL